MISDGTNVRFFAGFTLSLAFRYSLTFIVRLKKFQTTRPLFGVSSFLQLSFRDFGCGKAMSFDDLFRKDRPNTMLRRTAAPLGSRAIRIICERLLQPTGRFRWGSLSLRR